MSGRISRVFSVQKLNCFFSNYIIKVCALIKSQLIGMNILHTSNTACSVLEQLFLKFCAKKNLNYLQNFRSVQCLLLYQGTIIYSPCQLRIISRVSYPCYDLSIPSHPAPSFCQPVGHLTIGWHLGHVTEKALVLMKCNMPLLNASIKRLNKYQNYFYNLDLNYPVIICSI